MRSSTEERGLTVDGEWFVGRGSFKQDADGKQRW